MILPEKERLAIESESEQRKEYTKIGTYKTRIDGGTIFEYCLASGELKTAECSYPNEIVLGSMGANAKRRINTRVKCLYVEALNKKNAIKRLKRGEILLAT